LPISSITDTLLSLASPYQRLRYTFALSTLISKGLTISPTPETGALGRKYFLPQPLYIMSNAKLLIVEDEEIVAFDIESTLKV
jgi:hypothetical protein